MKANRFGKSSVEGIAYYVDMPIDEVIMFGNPCTMQIIAKHWTEEQIETPAKLVNAPLIEEFTGVSNYKGRADWIEI